MTKSILVSLAILTLSASAALAAHRTHHRHAIHSPAMNAFAGVGASPVVRTGLLLTMLGQIIVTLTSAGSGMEAPLKVSMW
ncbi:hypothetical protein SAMN05443247_04732 [Bradyrhizobium erythrophlei]|nr:hypothetical protein SAMN05443247_04732 [Bradyrhizobium erythrophlei]